MMSIRSFDQPLDVRIFWRSREGRNLAGAKHLQPIDCFEIAWIRMLGACDLLSAQRAKKNASVIVDYTVDQTARKRA